jgi:hypothetical protein
MGVSNHTVDLKSADLAHHVMPAGLDYVTWGTLKNGQSKALYMENVKLHKSV